MPEKRIVTGALALLNLVENFPTAHYYFGHHSDIKTFAARLNMQNFTVLEIENCWVFAQGCGDGVMDIHWFCPHGVDMPAIRSMLDLLFTSHGAEKLGGTTPKGYVNERAARVLSRALGAVRDGEGYALTKERFFAYNRDRPRALR